MSLAEISEPRSRRQWPAERLKSLSDSFEEAYPEDILRWAYDAFGRDVTMATGFGPSGVALMHMVSRVNPKAEIFYLDTDLLFPETHDLKDELSERLGLTFTRVHSGLSLEEQSDQEGPELWKTDPDRCCFIRKVLPLRNFLRKREAWLTGIRRDQSATRRTTGIVEWDHVNGLVKINPLANWTEDDVWQYVDLHDLPYNPLHDQGYPSIGCMPCTHPVAKGEDPRAGRWRGHSKTECGIHLNGSLADVAYRKSA